MTDDALTPADRRLKHLTTDGRFRRDYPREAEELERAIESLKRAKP